jgi:glycosyltransferase involved in cell wall biosynthesis
MKKILIVTDQINYGGVAKSLCDLLGVLDAENYQITVACIYGDMTPITDLDAKINIEFINLTGDYRDIANPILFLKYYLRFITKKYWANLYRKKIGNANYDVEIAYGAPWPFYFVSASTNVKSKKIGRLHSNADKINWAVHNKRLFRCALKIISDTVVVSRKLENSFLKSFNSENIQVIYNILDICQIRKLSFLYPVARREQFTLVFAGRLERQKRIDRLLVSLKKVIDDTGNELDLVIVGSGSLEKKLKNLSFKLGLDKNVRFVGYKENPFPFMKNADIFVLPSDFEGFGLVVGESLALGVPVIATDVEGPSEILGNDGKYGLLCEPTVESLADAIKRLIFDDEYYETMKGNVAGFDWPNDEIAQKISNLLEF